MQLYVPLVGLFENNEEPVIYNNTANFCDYFVLKVRVSSNSIIV
ncbi:MAG: hypothetical protein ACOXZ2_04095 [Sphaerochaetaceae bacterium]